MYQMMSLPAQNRNRSHRGMATPAAATASQPDKAGRDIAVAAKTLEYLFRRDVYRSSAITNDAHVGTISGPLREGVVGPI